MGKSRREHRNRPSQDEGGRIVRLQQLIREEVNLLLRCELTDERLDGVAITFVELAADGSCARLWFTSRKDESKDEDHLKGLERAAGFIRHHLADSLSLKRTPDLRFRRDPATRTFNNET
jgi:ribosome-binding factor A